MDTNQFNRIFMPEYISFDSVKITTQSPSEPQPELTGRKITLGKTLKQMIDRGGDMENKPLYRGLLAATAVGFLVLILGGAMFVMTQTDLLPEVGQMLEEGASAAQFSATFIGGPGATLSASVMLVGGVVLCGTSGTLFFFTLRVQKQLDGGETDSLSSSSEPLQRNRNTQRSHNLRYGVFSNSAERFRKAIESHCSAMKNEGGQVLQESYLLFSKKRPTARLVQRTQENDSNADFYTFAENLTPLSIEDTRQQQGKTFLTLPIRDHVQPVSLNVFEIHSIQVGDSYFIFECRDQNDFLKITDFIEIRPARGQQFTSPCHVENQLSQYDKRRVVFSFSSPIQHKS